MQVCQFAFKKILLDFGKNPKRLERSISVQFRSAVRYLFGQNASFMVIVFCLETYYLFCILSKKGYNSFNKFIYSFNNVANNDDS